MISEVADLTNAVIDWLDSFSASPWFYLVIFVIALLDSVIPLVPSETTVIVGGIAAGQGDLVAPAVIALGATGAYVGDTTAYLLGRTAGGPITRLFFRGEKGADRLARIGAQIRRRGGFLLVTARFIPGGRTALTFSCGLTRQPFWTWFTRWDLLAVSIWAIYAGSLGYFFGDRFEDDHTAAFWWAFGTALAVTLGIEAGRYVRSRLNSSDADADSDAGSDPGSDPDAGSDPGSDPELVGEAG